MISTQKDIKITYIENPNVYTEDDRNTLVVCDVLEKMSNPAVPFCKKITILEDLNEVTTKELNSEIYEFAQIFFNLNKRPQFFWLAACSANGSHGYLTTGNLDAWDAFKANFVLAGVPDMYTPLIFLITTGSGDTPCNYIVSGTELLAINGYDALLAKFQSQNQELLNFTLNDGKFNVSTNAIGSVDGTLSYMQDSVSTAEEGAYIIGGSDIGAFNDYKDEHAQCVFAVNDGDDNNIATFNVPTEALNSWEQLADALTEASGVALIVKYNTDHLFICRTMRGAASTIAVAGASGTDATVLKLTTEAGAIVAQGQAAVAAIQPANVLLKGTQDTASDKQDGKNEIGKQPIFMQSFKQLLDNNGKDPALLVLSPHITIDPASGATDLDVTKNMMRGFTEYFSYAESGLTDCAISVNSTLYLKTGELIDTGAFDEMKDDKNARNYFINYSRDKQYLDGAVAAYCTSFDWEGQSAMRDLFCKQFNGLNPDLMIDNALDSTLKEYCINFYAQMSNGDNVYRYGMTLSNGEVKNIITAVGINAFLKTLRSKLLKMREKVDFKMNGAGRTAIYSCIVGVCEAFVNNGFLSSIIFLENGKLTTVPPYDIQLPAAFNRQNIVNNVFPTVNIKIMPTVYAQQISIDISNQIWS